MAGADEVPCVVPEQAAQRHHVGHHLARPVAPQVHALGGEPVAAAYGGGAHVGRRHAQPPEQRLRRLGAGHAGLRRPAAALVDRHHVTLGEHPGQLFHERDRRRAAHEHHRVGPPAGGEGVAHRVRDLDRAAGESLRSGTSRKPQTVPAGTGTWQGPGSAWSGVTTGGADRARASTTRMNTARD
ncbi:hypothetical protein [Nonomuraea salmonea]|uniref:hypothetical protein n=1 Tax=Nonomuraea salmonea TaxID=46181 RepID=UPI0031ECA21A